MQDLKIKSILLSFCLFIPACQYTKVFSLKTIHEPNRSDKYDLHVINVSSNRVRQKCLFYDAEAENNWRHQYSMYVLNDKNEILDIMQSTNQDKDTCYSQIRKIDKILKSESQVKLCARDELEKATPENLTSGELINFGPLGNHKIAYEGLTFDSICNSKECFGDNSAWDKTCPGFIKQ